MVAIEELQVAYESADAEAAGRWRCLIPPQPREGELRQLDSNFENPSSSRTRRCRSSSTPRRSRSRFANQLVQPSGAGDQRGTPARQFVGAGTTKLTLTLWFDVTGSPLPPGERRGRRRPRADAEGRVLHHAEAERPGGRRWRRRRCSSGGSGGAAQAQFVPPAVRFVWGSFQFDGMMDCARRDARATSRPTGEAAALEPRPRALAAEDPRSRSATQAGAASPGAGGRRDHARDAAARRRRRRLDGAGARGRVPGVGASWQAIAAANGIENPRLLAPGR